MNISIKKSEIVSECFYELVDKKLLLMLIHSNISDDEWNYRTQLSKYLKNYDDKSGCVIVKYYQKDNIGRIYPNDSLGFSQMKREIRHTLAYEKMIDIDIVNCQPTLFYEVSKQMNIQENKNIEKYIKNRDQYLDIICSHYHVNREQSKNMFISMLYGGSIQKWKDIHNVDSNIQDIDIIQKWKQEIEFITNKILSNNNHIIDYVKSKDTKNINGSALSYYLQNIELSIIEFVYKYCCQYGYIINNVCSICHDGIMIEKKYYNEQLLFELKTLIKEKMNIDISFIVKKMDEKISIEQIKESVVENMCYPDTNELSLLFSYFYNDFLYHNHSIYYYNNVYWKKDQESIIIYKFIQDKYLCYLKEKINKIINVNHKDHVQKEQKSESDSENTKYEKYLIEIKKYHDHNKCEKLISSIKKRIYNDKIDFDTNPYIFSFENAIFDLKNNCFIEPKMEQYVSLTTGYDYDFYYNKENIEKISDLIKEILPNEETRNCYLSYMSTGMIGELIQVFLILSGRGGNGKGLLSKIISKMLGNYHYRMGSDVITHPLRSDGVSPQIMNMNHKRLISMVEPDSKKRMCASTIKELTGENCVNSRDLYQSECNSLNLCSTLFIECNDKPRIDEITNAITRRIVIIPFNMTYVSKESYDDYEDKTNILLANNYYSSFEFINKHKQAMFEILRLYAIDYINNGLKKKSVEIYNETKDYQTLNDDIYGWFEENFVRDFSFPLEMKSRFHFIPKE